MTELEKIDHWMMGLWHDADECLPPLGHRVVASDGKEIWLDMRLEILPDLGWKNKRAKYWCPFDDIFEYLAEKRRQELAAKRAAEEPDVVF
ncbi:hypothetical protein IVB34_12850 [Bradyrhizobium sp. 2]|uniref:hypothetical protein n=1 Tax=unclassified Bradyrhizobium TaxID=2631580 RepID=UPI001FF9843B|nr:MULTISPECIES: hypothetical protein [unclassified Bradyrhizobium]MCK1445443.1 hypothetical protein [Bradyrhizobium sp. 48]MCK1459177.1 hypothetical protein [Bradyrhizobium sp. 2]MCK1459244.1 hypothetical protein [Bradyrhizobium sp. 2]